MKSKKVKKALTILAVIGIMGIVGMGAFAMYVTYNLPDPEQIANREVVESTKIYDRTGDVLLYEIHGEEKRTIVAFESIPEYVKQATIAIEDDAFYTHPAFDWRSIVRAVIKDITQGQLSQGGSTITQQLAKNAFLTTEKTLTRKIKELVLAFRIEKYYEKDEILNLYLNQIPYGGNAYGVEAASQTYFNKSISELTLAEAALLAALPQAPTYYSPWGSHQEDLFARQRSILKRMEELGYIDEEERLRAEETELEIAPQLITSIKAPHFVIYVQDYLVKKYGEEFLEKGGLRVTTTLDWELQEIAEKAVTEGVKRNTELYGGKNAALVAKDANTGQILAMVGSADYFDTENEGNFNVATQGLRQPGSAFKPFAYLTAFEKGYTPDTVVFDVPTEFDTTGRPEKSYKPHNFDEQFRGPISLKEALAESINIPAVKTLYLAGIDETLETVRNFGINTLNERSRFGLSLVLGGGEVKLTELVGAYTVLAEEGIKHDEAVVLKIETSKGKVLEEYADKAEIVVDSQYPRLINEILSDVSLRAPLFSASLGLTQVENYDVALKTGTTNNYVDAWTIGYTPDIVVGVWAGNNHREPLKQKGGSILAAVPIWHAFASKALPLRTTPQTFTKPDPIIVEKPILNGELSRDQVHTILYFVDKDNPLGSFPQNPAGDSQFENWEEAVQIWFQTNSNNIDWARFTKQGDDTISSGGIGINLKTPENGDFIKDKVLIEAEIKAVEGIQKIELHLNNRLIETKESNLGTELVYKTIILGSELTLQNQLVIKVWDSKNKETSKEIILFK
ncbi:MAG: hypothetical protein A3I31_03130 [Candidatus Colwellbacteria bacterium RIFCSPLOWO2_02_FULL_44_20b]|uniref:Uncharacterized protein n=1 Tax=Candidatus Colwellbacteria bacterium RIFCSPLOWO2_02_FULL_44_20b TaxID=1797691 RepID=A0A1G1Z619_9BACT|nr:MAG: hypothetical protein A3I31_03130 [Candidatus Colwellbacteria bacterium RIFCSPLOWO2_02_FULL_44_20b]